MEVRDFDVDEIVSPIEDDLDEKFYFSDSEDERRNSWMLQRNYSSRKIKTKKGSEGRVTQVPRYVVNLDAPPEERWSEIAFRYRHDLKGVRDVMKKEMEDVLGPKKTAVVQALVNLVMGTVTSVGAVFYGRELKGISARTGMPVGELVMTQLAYEAAACCTSVVIEHEGKPIHFRTMDWGMDYLKGLTIEVDFQRGGQTVFLATTWPGYVGVLTGMRPGAFSTSVNFRVTGDGYWSNVKKTLAYSWPVGFLLREVLETVTSFDSAVGALALSKLIAPVYFTIGGTEAGQGVLITRNREGEESRWNLSEHGAIVQTNIDHWSNNEDDDILYSIERRSLARSLLDSLESVDDESIWELLSVPPIFNQLTIYGTIMKPSSGEFVTRLPQEWERYNPDGFKPCDDPIPFGGADRKRCSNCGIQYIEALNVKADCGHVGQWHSSFGDCNYLKCGFGLKSNIGTQHWSCCFSTIKKSACPKSDLHTHEGKEK